MEMVNTKRLTTLTTEWPPIDGPIVVYYSRASPCLSYSVCLHLFYMVLLNRLDNNEINDIICVSDNSLKAKTYDMKLDISSSVIACFSV